MSSFAKNLVACYFSNVPTQRQRERVKVINVQWRSGQISTARARELLIDVVIGGKGRPVREKQAHKEKRGAAAYHGSRPLIGLRSNW